MEDVYSKGGVCNAGNSDKKYGSKHKDVSLQENKSKFNHSRNKGHGTFHWWEPNIPCDKNYISLSFRSVVGCGWSKPVQMCMI